MNSDTAREAFGPIGSYEGGDQQGSEEILTHKGMLKKPGLLN